MNNNNATNNSTFNASSFLQANGIINATEVTLMDGNTTLYEFDITSSIFNNSGSDVFVVEKPSLL